MTASTLTRFTMDLGRHKRKTPDTVATDSTKYYADSVEWCHLEPFQDFFICGTYQMEEASERSSHQQQVRRGNVVLYHIVKNLENFGGYSLKLKASIDTSGVLDMKWAPHYVNEKCTAGVAFSDGNVKLLQMCNNEDEDVSLTALCGINVAAENGVLALSLDWSSWKSTDSQENIIVSDSSGYLSQISLSDTGLNLLKKWKAHDFEAWIAAFDYNNVNTIFSGGDDCCLKSWDVRTDLSVPVLVSRSHEMGVTSITKSRQNENFLATGSYDEYVRIWDTRKMKVPLSSAHVGGGVWRIKWHPMSPHHLLTAAMHGGFHVLQLDCESGLDVISSYSAHKSLAYGVDWCWSYTDCPVNILKEQSVSSSLSASLFPQTCAEHHVESFVASCSFYDKSVHLWSVQLPCLT